MTSGTLTRSERRRARTTGAILDAAERLFAERGFGATTMEAIAEESGFALGSIYRHFRGKDDVHLALVERALELNERLLEEAYASADTPLARIAAAGAAYARLHLEHPAYLRLLGQRDLGPNPRVARRLEAMADGLAAVIADAVEAGEIRPVDPALTARFLWGAWNGVVALRARGVLDDAGLAAALRLGDELVLDGLRAGA